jgi:hypothetical protein
VLHPLFTRSCSVLALKIPPSIIWYVFCILSKKNRTEMASVLPFSILFFLKLVWLDWWNRRASSKPEWISYLCCACKASLCSHLFVFQRTHTGNLVPSYVADLPFTTVPHSHRPPPPQYLTVKMSGISDWREIVGGWCLRQPVSARLVQGPAGDGDAYPNPKVISSCPELLAWGIH